MIGVWILVGLLLWAAFVGLIISHPAIALMIAIMLIGGLAVMQE